jgi:hypothetical protein
VSESGDTQARPPLAAQADEFAVWFERPMAAIEALRRAAGLLREAAGEITQLRAALETTRSNLLDAEQRNLLLVGSQQRRPTCDCRYGDSAATECPYYGECTTRSVAVLGSSPTEQEKAAGLTWNGHPIVFDEDEQRRAREAFAEADEVGEGL